MKNILIILFCFIIFNNSVAQKASDNISKLSGIWTGTVEKHPIKFEISQNKSNSFIFSFINFQNERFNIFKYDISTIEKNKFIIQIKEAKFSSPNFDECIFSKGVLTIYNITQDNMTLNLKSVGPNCFLSYDVIMNMPDINDTILTKEKSNK